MFSVIIPLFNKERSIVNTINSVLQQTYRYFELIIVNDGSTDHSLQIITETFKDERRIIIINQENRGVSAARNTGIKYASSELIAFIDGDDLWHPQFLEYMHASWIKNPHLSIIGCQITRVELGHIPHYKLDDQIHDNCVTIENYFEKRPGHYSSSSSTLKKSLFDKIDPFDEGLVCGEDLDVWYRILYYFDGGFINRTLSYYTYANLSAGKYDFLPDINKHLVSHALLKYQNLLNANNHKSKAFKKHIYFYILSMLTAYYYYKGEKKATKLLYGKIPTKYKFSRIRDLVIILPYPIGKFIFNLYN